MRDSYEINEHGEVVPYSGGRMSTDTRAWRDATELELQQRDEIECLRSNLQLVEQILHSVREGIQTAIDSGDWKVDGACDPSMDLERIDAFLGRQNDV